MLDVERAGVPSRVLAIAIDVLGLGFATYLLTLLAVALSGGLGDAIGAIAAIIASLTLYLCWFAGFETFMQRTPGKAALGLRVVSTDGTPVRFQQAFLRAVLGIVDFFVVPIGFVGVVTSLLSPLDQRLGDMAAGTLVVRQRSASSFVAPAQFPAPPGYERYVEGLDVSAMTTEQYGLVRTFLLRAHHLNPVARVQLAVRLANPLAAVLHHTPPNHLHPEAFLVCVAASWQRAHGGGSSFAPPWPQTASWTPPPPPPVGVTPWSSSPPPPPRPLPPPPVEPPWGPRTPAPPMPPPRV